MWWTPPRRGPVASKWTPVSAWSPPRAAGQAVEFSGISGVAGGFWTPVASQKTRPVAGEVPRCAPQHTFQPERNRKTMAWRFGSGPFGGHSPRKNRLRSRFAPPSRPPCPTPTGPRSGFRGPPRKPARRPPASLATLPGWIAVPSGLVSTCDVSRKLRCPRRFPLTRARSPIVRQAETW